MGRVFFLFKYMSVVNMKVPNAHAYSLVIHASVCALCVQRVRADL